MDRSRFAKFLSPTLSKSSKVGLVGVGTINGWLALSLARLGIGYIWLCDDDRVGEENIATQPWLPGDVGKLKVDAMREMLLAVEPEVAVEMQQQRVPEGLEGLGGLDVIVVGTDNIESRKAVAQWWVHEDRTEVLIDHRMGLTNYECNVIVKGGEYTKEYLKCLDEDKSYSEDPCGMHAVSFTGMHAAARVASVIASVLPLLDEDGEVVPCGWWSEELRFPELVMHPFHDVGVKEEEITETTVYGTSPVPLAGSSVSRYSQTGVVYPTDPPEVRPSSVISTPRAAGEEPEDLTLESFREAVERERERQDGGGE